MKLIAHIGITKTGTSAIQKFLWENRKSLLKKYGVLYPESGSFNVSIYSYKAHYKIAFCFDTFEEKGLFFQKDEILSSLIDEIRQVMPEVVILSCETFSLIKKPEEFFESLRKLDFKEFYLVLYIRRQDLWFESSYKQVVKTGQCSTFFSKKPSRIHLEIIDFNRFLAKWIPFVLKDNIYIRIYDRKTLYLNNIVTDFCFVLSKILKQDLGLDDEFSNYNNANPSLSHISTLVKLKINLNYKLTPKEHWEVSNYLLKLDREEGSGPLKTFFTLDERIEFLEIFRESNERLFREWFNSENKFVLTQEEIEFYKEQDRIPKEEIERFVEERYQKVVENVIKKIEAKPKVYIPVKIEKLAKEVEIVEKVWVDQLYLDLLKESKLVIGGVVVQKADVKGEYRLLVEDGEGIKEVKWGIPSPGYAKMYPDNPYAKNARFEVKGVVFTEDKPIRLYIEGKNKDRIIIYEIKITSKGGIK